MQIKIMRTVILLSVLAIGGATQAADLPQWWYTRGIVNTQLIANDYAPANVGQLKQAVYQTWVEMTNVVANPQYTAQDSATITNTASPDGTFKVSTDGKLMLAFGGQWFVFTPEATVTPPVNPPPSTNTPAGMVLVQGGTLPDIGNGVITVSNFCIGQTEVTWGEWQAVQTWAATNGYDLSGVGSGCSTNHPVIWVNWYDVVKWCNAHSEKEGRAPVYTVSGVVYKIGQNDAPVVNASANGYRLPTDAEWEFAARGGTQSHGYIYSGGTNLDTVGWYDGNSSGSACGNTWPVGQKAANELGLYDMSGNVWEWCFDWYPGYEGYQRFFRGGSWLHAANFSQVDVRNFYRDPAYSSHHIGFRLAVSFTAEYMNILAQDDTAHTLRNTPCVIHVLANDIGEGLVVQSVTQPANGTVSNGGTNVVYTPALNFEGTDIFSYGLGSLYGSAIGQVTVTVSHVIIN